MNVIRRDLSLIDAMEEHAKAVDDEDNDSK